MSFQIPTTCSVSASSLKVRVGSDQKGSGGLLISVKKITIHENYSGVTINFDFALLKLAQNIVATTKVGSINLANNEPQSGETSFVTGWGALREGGSSPVQLQGVKVPVISRVDCNKAYNGAVTNQMICAGTEKGGKDSCQGDSGGPLVVNKKLAGVVSWGNGCARKGIPGVYSNVAHAKPWIEKNMV